VGTVAAYGKPGHVYRFYEINPVVEQLARTSFTYLGDCEGHCEVVLGDARIMLDREADQDYDVLILDAFSGDAIPTHLLTNEAMQVYLRHLKPDGILVVHITNSYIQLAEVVRSLAAANGLSMVRVETSPPDDDPRPNYSTDYMLLARRPELLAGIQGTKIEPRDPPDGQYLWTDDFSDLWSVMISRPLFSASASGH
jgi:spermidine synthase